MPDRIKTKICGIKSVGAMRAAMQGPATFVGFVFFPPSPRYIAPIDAGVIAALAGDHIKKVGLFVDPSDDELQQAIQQAKIDIIQLHGSEPPERVAEVKSLTGLPVIKAIGVATADDLKAVTAFEETADYILFDAKPAPKEGSALPGGNAKSFDWSILAGLSLKKPWFLAGGLTPENLAEAVQVTRAPMVDVSSGVERSRGIKDNDKITAFLDIAKSLS